MIMYVSSTFFILIYCVLNWGFACLQFRSLDVLGVALYGAAIGCGKSGDNL